MALIHNYAIWNNKGGVGKSTITFHIASRYAEMYPQEDVFVIDMCPQANSSMMLLGGGTSGEINVLRHCTLQTPQTVVGYITSVLSSGAGATRPDPNSFTINVSQINDKLPTNLYLLCGDGNLEPIAPAIAGYANMPPIVPNSQPWVWVHSIIREYINDMVANRQQQGRDISVFIDTNPAFGVYTELAVASADRLICPVNADDSSRTAASAMAILLHGSNPQHPVYGQWTFASKASANQMAVPAIHLIVGNRFTQYDGAATAYRAMSDATAQQMYNLYQNHQNYFTISNSPIGSLDEFRDHYSVFLRDFNTSGVVAAHTGALLSRMHGGHYQVYGVNVTLDNRRISECLAAIDEVIVKL